MATATVSTERLPALAHPVPLSGSLAYHVAGNSVIDGVLIQARGTPSARDIHEAANRLDEAQWKCEPAEAMVVREWIRRLAPHLPRAPKAEMEMAIGGMLAACGDLPRVCWTAETLTGALRTFEWWPPPAKLRAFLEPFAAPFLRTRDGLRRIANHHPQAMPQRRQSPTEDELSAVTASMTAFMAERSWNQPGQLHTARVIKSAPISDGQLLAIWEHAAAMGMHGASVRLNALRDKAGIRMPVEREPDEDEGMLGDPMPGREDADEADALV